MESEKANWDLSFEEGRERPAKRRGRRVDFCCSQKGNIKV